LQGYGSPDWRLIAQLGWQFRFQHEAPVETAAAEPEERPEVVVPLAASVAVDEPAEEAVVDTDKDGTADNEDHCPVLAGPTELAGCPEHVSYDQTTGAITLSPAPGFVRASERLDTRSLTALESLARALSIGGKQRLLISVHLDPRSKPDLTFRTEERARVLMEYLIGRGVPAQKLDVWACAGNSPRVTSRRFESANERAEFFLTLPLPEQGMPSSVGCNAVDLPP
jgi:outer membrane protein OmpA-like peptidoglycan-associated protein